MQITVKLFASLAQWLPNGARDNAVQLTVDNATSAAEVLSHLNVPKEHCHLVLVNGLYVAPSDRANHRLSDGDTVAAWPPVAGG